MKKLIAGVILLGILSSCGNKKTNIDPFASITKEVDSVRQIADSSHHDKSPEDPQPIQADESFDDFIYNFASDDARAFEWGFLKILGFPMTSFVTV